MHLLFLFCSILVSSTVAFGASPEGSLVDVALSPDGNFVISSATGGNVHVWDLRRLLDKHQPTYVLSFNSGSDHVSVSQQSGQAVYIFAQGGKIAAFKLGGQFSNDRIWDFSEHFRIPYPYADRIRLYPSPDGRRVLAAADKTLYLLDVDKKIERRMFDRELSSICVGWSHGLIYLGHASGTVEVVSLETLSAKGSIHLTDSGIRKVLPLNYGETCIAVWQENHLKEKFALLSLDSCLKTDQALIKKHGTGYRPDSNFLGQVCVPSADGANPWLAMQGCGGHWEFYRFDNHGEASPDRRFHIWASPGDIPMMVGSKADRVLFDSGDSQFAIADVTLGRTAFKLSEPKVLFNVNDSEGRFSRTHYAGEDLSHLQSRAGSEILMPKDFTKHSLLTTLAMHVKAGVRLDSLWFDLLSDPRVRWNSGDRGKLNNIGIICRWISELLAIENAAPDNSDQLLKATRELLVDIRNNPLKIPFPTVSDVYEPVLDDLIFCYVHLIEKDAWIMFGNLLRAKGLHGKAEKAYRIALEIEPLAWRAYQGLLSLAMSGQDEKFKRIEEESQNALAFRWHMVGESLRGWQPFFEMDEIRQSRTILKGLGLKPWKKTN